jgi:type I restriction enzyme, S subunit
MGGELQRIHLGELYEFGSGLSKPRNEFGFGYPFVTFKDVFDNYFLPETLGELVNATQDERNNCSIIRGDVLLTRTSETAHELGMSCVVLRTVHNATFNGFTKRLRPKTAIIDPLYAGYFFRSKIFRDQVFALSNMSTRASLNNEILDKLVVLVPAKENQVAIGETLKALDDKIDLSSRTAATLEEIARALFKSWFVDFDPVRAKAEGRPTGLPDSVTALFPGGFGDNGLPKGWRQSNVATEFNLTMGQSPPGSSYNETGTGTPLYQGRTDFGFRFPTRRVFTTAPARMAAKGDTLVSVRAPVGDLNMASALCCVGRGVAAVRHKSGSSSYTYYAFQSIQPSIAAFEDDGTVFGAINKEALGKLRVLKPADSAISAFHEHATVLDERISKLLSEIEVTTTLRDTLLPKLISGELRVADAEQQVSAA